MLVVNFIVLISIYYIPKVILKIKKLKEEGFYYASPRKTIIIIIVFFSPLVFFLLIYVFFFSFNSILDIKLLRIKFNDFF